MKRATAVADAIHEAADVIARAQALLVCAGGAREVLQQIADAMK